MYKSTGPPIADDVDAFMATMVMDPHPLPLERAARLAREHYGLEARITRLTGERDENFRLSGTDGRDYVLKVAHRAEDAAITDLAAAALLHLERQDSALPCPRLVRERGGHSHARFTDDQRIERTARLLTYLPGRPLGPDHQSRRLRAECGRLGGRLIRALRTFSHPAAHRTIVWDVRHAAQLARLLGEVPGFPCRREALAVLAGIVPRIESQLPQLRQQIVHNDLNPKNILVAETGEVTGIIDFGDMTYTAVIADVAVTAAEHIPEDCRAGSGEAAASVLDVANAYHESVPLSQQEFAVLGTLVAARLVANMVVHEWHVHRNPAGAHYRPLGADFIQARLKIAAELALEAGGS
jgi:Ser/Thr protein kinase RdoA (MazF antagonist)